MSTPPPPRRKRFQFSLRTLMLAVLTYGMLWLITLKWGGAALARHYADEYEDDKPVINAGEGSLEISHRVRPLQIKASWSKPIIAQFRGRAICPAPFILLWRWESKTNELLNEFKPIEGDSDQYLWFFGYRKAWSKPRPPYFQSRQWYF